MSAQIISKKQFKHKKNTVAVKVTLDDESGLALYTVVVVCARRKKRVRGLLTCGKDGVQAATKRLIKNQLIHG